jgi:NADH:ubiquinone oxidoreductase subunit F (NADH-binding)
MTHDSGEYKKIIITCCQDSNIRYPEIRAFYYAVSLLGNEDIIIMNSKLKVISIMWSFTPWHGAASCCRWKR